MKTSYKLAIIIPAYKIEFFQQTIQSIANQTCKDFTLYIGDDASPYSLEEVVQPFYDEIEIIYKRFENNLGDKNLVDHWNRCVDLIKDEDWIWFFSDDDLMDIKCVELFYQHIANNPNQTFLHFNLQIINQVNEPIYRVLKFPSYLSTANFFTKRLNSEIHSCAVEYVFKRKLFEKANRFESFDLAWASDDATWIKLSVDSGIHTIEGACVRWRQSGFNISPRSDNNTINRKLNAIINYIKWARHYFQLHNIKDNSSGLEKAGYAIKVITYTKSLSYKEKFLLISHVAKSLNLNNMKLKMALYWMILELKAKVKHLIAYDKRLANKLATPIQERTLTHNRQISLGR